MMDQLSDALGAHDIDRARQLLLQDAELRTKINAPVFGFDAPAIVAFARDSDAVGLLLEFGADPNARSIWWGGGFHALHSATGAAAEKLLAAGAVPDACAAANLDDVALLRRILDADPSRVHERGGDGQTPLHFARSREVVDVLLSRGADIDARDVDHRSSPAEWMLQREAGAGRYELARYLVERGAHADVFLAAALGLTHRLQLMLQDRPELLALRTGHGSYGERPPSSYHIYYWSIGAGLSPLDVARQFGHADAVHAMLAFALPVERLLYAAQAADESLARVILQAHPGLVQGMSLEQHGALAAAAWNGSKEAVFLMLELGFDPRATGQDGGTALHLASWEGAADVVAAILRHPSAAELLVTRDATHHATPLGWCCHGSIHGRKKGDFAEVARRLLAAGARLGDGTREASSAVRQAFAEAGHPFPTAS